MNKLIATIGLTAALGAGAFAVGAVLPVGAQEDPPGSEEETTTEGRWQRPHILDDALAGLVEDGTLTQPQADAVREAVRAEIAEYPGRRHPRRHRILAGSFEIAAETIGVSVEDLRSAVGEGQSVGDVAEANGIDPQDVIDALVAAGTERVDEAVVNGRVSEERAEEIKAHLAEAAERFVNFTKPAD